MRRLLNILIFVLIFVLYFVTFLMIYSDFRERKLNSLEEEAVELFENKIDKKVEPSTSDKTYSISYNGYTILGVLTIPKIGLNTVILKEQTYSAMNIGAIKTYGVNLNEKGGNVISGHNFRGHGSFFYYIKNLKSGDIISITDNRGRTIEYKVYEVSRYVSPDDTSYYTRYDGYHITLVTCENGGKSRIIVKARYDE